MLFFLLFFPFIFSSHLPKGTPPYWESGAYYRFKASDGGSGQAIFTFPSPSRVVKPSGLVVMYRSESIPLGYKQFNHDTKKVNAITLDKYTNFTTPICLHPEERMMVEQPCKNGKFIGTQIIQMKLSHKSEMYLDVWTNCNFTNYFDFFGKHIGDQPFTFYNDIYDNTRTWKICMGNIEKYEECKKFVELFDYKILSHHQVADYFSEPWLCQ